jgi:putative flippase GtrA
MLRTLIFKLPWLELVRFGATGLMSVGVYLCCLAPLTKALPGRLWLAGAVAYVLSMVANYVLQRNFTFRSTRRHHEAVSRYLVVHAVAIGINSGLLHVLTVSLKSSLWIAQGAAVVCVAIWSYTAQKLWVFIGHRHSVDSTPSEEC